LLESQKYAYELARVWLSFLWPKYSNCFAQIDVILPLSICPSIPQRFQSYFFLKKFIHIYTWNSGDSNYVSAISWKCALLVSLLLLV